MGQPQTYDYAHGDESHSHAYVLPVIEDELASAGAERVFEIGCGNGAAAGRLARNYMVEGVDASAEGIAQANKAHPNLRLEQGSGYDDLSARFGVFDAVISVEVIAHLLDPRLFAKRAYDLVRPGGVLILATPYHGYFKNLALSLSGKMDAHFNPLWDHGQIKFWSVRTLTQLLRETGFCDVRMRYAGRITPYLAKSMIAVARRQAS